MTEKTANKISKVRLESIWLIIIDIRPLIDSVKRNHNNLFISLIKLLSFIIIFSYFFCALYQYAGKWLRNIIFWEFFYFFLWRGMQKFKQRKPWSNYKKHEKAKAPAWNSGLGLLLLFFSFSLFFFFLSPIFSLLFSFSPITPLSSSDALHPNTSRKYVFSFLYPSSPWQTLSCLLFLFYSIPQLPNYHQFHKGFLTPPRK